MPSSRASIFAVSVALAAGALGCGRGASGSASDLRAESASRTFEQAPTPVAVEAPRDGRVPVVVELFSSEGCSSCPRADEVLRRLQADQPVAGAEVIPLEFHVDYWNDLGWVDPFSKPEFSERQRSYAASRGTDSIFTPEAVIDGHGSTVGNHAGAVVDRIHDAAEQRHLRMTLTLAAGDAPAISLSIVDAPEPKTSLFAAVTEAGLTTRVEAGENAGRTLEHAPVVRAFTRIGDAQAGTRSIDVPRVESTADRGGHTQPRKLTLVVFAQAPGGSIVGAASASLTTAGDPARPR